jgi:hypothetical protein
MALLGDWPGGRVDQIALLTPDLHAAMDAYVATLGVSFQVFEVDETNSVFSGSSASFRTRFGVALAAGSSIELIQPVSGTTIHSEHLRTRGPGLHHIGVYVPRLSDAEAALSGRGYRKLMEGNIERLGQFAYFEAGGLGCIVEPLQLSMELPLFLMERAKRYP